MAAETIPARLQAQGKRRPDHPAYAEKLNGQWLTTTYSTYAQQVRTATKALIKLGLEAGHTTCILGFNRPEWAIFDLATMTAGGAPAGIYTTCSPVEVSYIIAHAEARIVLLEDAGQWAKVLAELDNLPGLEHVVMMRGAESIEHDKVMSWEAFVALAEGVEDSTVEERLENLEDDQLATFIYTSGTTGPPKGVMLSHKNLVWTADCAEQLVALHENDCSLSYLPLSHIAEQIFTLHGPITFGYQVFFAESIEAVKENLAEVRPTVLFAVPRIWEKFHAGISAKLKNASLVKAFLFGWATSVGSRYNDNLNRRQTVPGLLQLQYRLADRLIYSKVKGALGLDRLRFAVSGAAPIAAEVLEFFAGIDIVVREVYGQSEDTGPTSFNIPGATRFGSVGQPIPGVEVAIADDGEILVKGPNVFLGYYKEKAATDETLIDGWLYSGDLGSIDDEGFLHITGRKKEIIITAGGKNIAPKNIEAALKNHELIAEAVIIGDRRKYLSALLWLDPDVAEKKASALGCSVADLPANADLVAEVEAITEQVNSLFARVEWIRKFTTLTEPLSVENSELTPTLKVKRKVINERYAEQIEAMYADA